MKRRMLTRIRVEKQKRAGKRGRYRRARVRDTKDLRGAKGALLKSAADVGLKDELAESRGRVRRAW